MNYVKMHSDILIIHCFQLEKTFKKREREREREYIFANLISFPSLSLNVLCQVPNFLWNLDGGESYGQVIILLCMHGPFRVGNVKVNFFALYDKA